jgi:hypothetical protein
MKCKNCDKPCGAESLSQAKRLRVQGRCNGETYAVKLELRPPETRRISDEAWSALLSSEVAKDDWYDNHFVLKNNNSALNIEYLIFKPELNGNKLFVTGGLGSALYDFPVENFQEMDEYTLDGWSERCIGIEDGPCKKPKGKNIHPRIIYHYMGFKMAMIRMKDEKPTG